MKTQILLSTYNGERYLREQLDSFVSLEGFSDIGVLIRDDGSTDSTREILGEYAELYGFEVILGENIGLNASMLELMRVRNKDCSCYSFADQDDVWLPAKLSRAWEALDGKTEPTLYTACSSITDEKLNITGHLRIPKRAPSFYNAMVENISAGHTQVMNRALMELLVEAYTANVVIFDHFVYLFATSVGEVIYDEECTTLYRQHGNNVVGYSSGFFGRLRIQLRALAGDIAVKTSRQLALFLEREGDRLPREYGLELSRFLSSRRNFFTRLGYLFRSRFMRQSRLETLAVKMIYLFGFYGDKSRKN